ncbi:MAG: translation initiation factor IF-6 [Candidatus Hecatellales archaeon]|nr:MAG: translation initiation factor IF-6 [Candidatus Hecatellales archaeon]
MVGVRELTVTRASVMGSPNIGVFARATDSFAIFPEGIPARKLERVSRLLEVKVVSLDLGYSKLIGVLSAANSRGIIVPHYLTEEEEKFLREKLEVEVERLRSKHTSAGNLILANDRGAVVSPLLGRRELQTVEDILGVEAVYGSIAGIPLPGSMAAATNRGAMLHPQASDEEVKKVAEVLKVRVGVGTVNGGVSYVSSGIVGNSKALLVGSLTTGPELLTISTIFE